MPHSTKYKPIGLTADSTCRIITHAQSKRRSNAKLTSLYKSYKSSDVGNRTRNAMVTASSRWLNNSPPPRRRNMIIRRRPTTERPTVCLCGPPPSQTPSLDGSLPSSSTPGVLCCPGAAPVGCRLQRSITVGRGRRCSRRCSCSCSSCR